jgi:predicted dehydrogenase
MKKKMNVAVIGIGYWGPNLVRNFVNHPSVDKVFCYDIDEKRSSHICEEFPKVTKASSYEEILNNPDIEAVAIATPVATHFHLAQQALEHGKHAFIEKPFTSSVQDATTLIDLAHKKKLKLMVDHIFAYNGAIRKIKKIINSGEIGEIMYFDAVRINLGLFQHDVNVVWDLAPHDLSIMDYLLPEKPRAVSAVGISHFSPYEDIAYLTLLFNHNCIAHLHVNWLSPVKVRNIIIGGTNKMICFNDTEATEKIKIYNKGVDVTTKEGIYKTLIQYRTGDVLIPQFDTSEPLTNVVAEFIDSIEKNKNPITDGTAGLHIVQILEAAQKSIKADGAVVPLT